MHFLVSSFAALLKRVTTLLPIMTTAGETDKRFAPAVVSEINGILEGAAGDLTKWNEARDQAKGNTAVHQTHVHTEVNYVTRSISKALRA